MTDAYLPPFFLFNGHLETIYPALFRRVSSPPFTAQRIATPDNDFLDTRLYSRGSKKIVILSHGLEGRADRPYIVGMGNACLQKGFDVLAWNFRGCGDEMNRQLRFYHSGATDDLDVIVSHVSTLGYEEIHLIGFSLGGNVTLKYLGENRTLIPSLKKAAVFSVPMDLHTSCHTLSLPYNRVYANRFLKSLKKKIRLKAKLRKELDTSHLEKIRTLKEFDNFYTAPLHGFNNAVHYYDQCSSIRFVASIRTPTLIINAKNDPFLSPECYPETLLRGHPYVQFENPAKGGHVGFAQFNKNGLYWSEERALDFLSGNSSMH